MKKITLFLLLSTFIWSCTVKPEPINYGQDGCHYCKMTIVDKIHATEIVTQKGKIYKFDASECMIHFMGDFEASEIKLFLTNVYENPETLENATNATFLISKKIPSPMGAFLTAFKTKDAAEKVQAENGGTLYTWNQLLEHLNNS